MAALTTDQLLDCWGSFNVRGKWEVLVDTEKIVYGEMRTMPPVEAIRSTNVTGSLTVEQYTDAMKSFTTLEREEFSRALRQRLGYTTST